MNPSDELKNVMLRFYERMSAGDINAIENFFSHQKGVLVVGSDPNEWWADYDTIIRAFKQQFAEMGTPKIEPGDFNAFVEGTVGWADRRLVRRINGREITIRETLVWHLEDGEWKIVQLHASLAVPNEEVVSNKPAMQ